MKRLWQLALIGVLLLSGTAAWADSEFYVIAAGPTAVGTKITSVPYEIKNSGFYYLTGNLTYSGSGNAITVNHDDVTLDLMGFSLTNSGAKGSTKGISMDGRTNVEIRNGTVRGFQFGVYESNSAGTKHRAINVRTEGNSSGLYFTGSNHLIKNCNASNNTGTGLGFDSGLIIDCVAFNNGIGILVYGPGNVLCNVAFNNSSRNFSLGNDVATAIMVDRNSAFGLSPDYNYFVYSLTTGIKWGINAGAAP
jgi:hypothetical protein